MKEIKFNELDEISKHELVSRLKGMHLHGGQISKILSDLNPYITFDYTESRFFNYREHIFISEESGLDFLNACINFKK